VAPTGLFVFLALIFVLIKVFFHPVGFFNQLINGFFICLFVFYFLVFAYLGYWFFYYLKMRKKAKNVS
jgi:hypothetical protein